MSSRATDRQIDNIEFNVSDRDGYELAVWTETNRGATAPSRTALEPS